MERLKIFKRNKIPIEIKTLAITTYIQTSSIRKTARIIFRISVLKGLNLKFEHQTFGQRRLIESVFSSLKRGKDLSLLYSY